MKPIKLLVPATAALLLAALVELSAHTSAVTTLNAAGLTVTDAATGQPATVLTPRLGPVPALEISQRGAAFVPDHVTIRPHRSIRIRNDDTTTHHAFCQNPEMKFTSGPMAPGTDINLRFPTPGTYEVRCAIHPKMLLVVTVESD